MKTISSISTIILILSLFTIACSSDQHQTGEQEIVSPDLNIPATHHVNGFATGVQSFTFNRFSAFESIEKTAEAGGRIIEIYPGQRLSPDDDTPSNQLSDEQIAQLHEKLREHDILFVNYGVVVMPTPEEARSVFEYAQKLGVPAITANPNTPEEMDFLEELVQEFDIMLAIHNHPRPEDPDSEYRIWDPVHVMNLLDGRDARMGICADTGHWIRSGISPLDALQLSEGRVISLHMKDVDRNSREAEDVIFGTGVGQISEILTELTRQNFAGHISIEHEANWENNVPDVTKNVNYIRNWTR